MFILYFYESIDTVEKLLQLLIQYSNQQSLYAQKRKLK